VPPAATALRSAAGALFCLLAALAPPGTSAAQATAPGQPAAARVVLSGQVQHPRTLDMAELQAMPPTQVQVAYSTSHGAQSTTYTGALLWTLLEAAVPVDEPGGHTHLRHTLLARGQDGYTVAVSMGELDPHMEGKQVIIAYAQDGKPLPALRLVVPGDSHAGRGVRDLAAIEVR
jgi:DMSO/TMAO reductase YedYZ molybdopterin-dependent catalytic subunit